MRNCPPVRWTSRRYGKNFHLDLLAPRLKSLTELCDSWGRHRVISVQIWPQELCLQCFVKRATQSMRNDSTCAFFPPIESISLVTTPWVLSRCKLSHGQAHASLNLHLLSVYLSVSFSPRQELWKAIAVNKRHKQCEALKTSAPFQACTTSPLAKSCQDTGSTRRKWCK